MNVAHPVILRQFRFIAAGFKARRAVWPKVYPFAFSGNDSGNGEKQEENNGFRGVHVRKCIYAPLWLKQE